MLWPRTMARRTGPAKLAMNMASATAAVPRSTTLTSLRTRHDDIAHDVRRCEVRVERLRSELALPPDHPGADAAGRAGDDLRGARPRAGARPPGADLPRAAPGGRRAGLLAGLKRVADGLRADQAVAEHERVDAVLGVRLLRLRVPLDEQHVTLEDLRRDVPLGVQQVGEQLLERLAHAVLAVEGPVGRDEHRVV